MAYPGPIVFEGNAPADVRENAVLRGLLEAPSVKPAAAGRIWLGAPNSIKGPTEAVFQRQSGNNLLLVGQRDEAMLAMLSVGLVSLAAQYPRGTTRFIRVRFATRARCLVASVLNWASDRAGDSSGLIRTSP